MRLPVLTTAVLCLLPCLHAAPKGCSAGAAKNGDDAGWQVLSAPDAARTWTGGIGTPFPARAWRIEGACLVLEEPRHGGSLFSAVTYDDFELVFDWRIAPGGNSGVKYMAVPGRIHPDFYRFIVWPGLVSLAVASVVLIALALSIRRRLSFFRTPLGRRIGIGLALLPIAWIVSVSYGMTRSYRHAAKYPTGLEYQMTDDGGNSDALSKPSHKSGALYDLIAPASTNLKSGDEFNETRIVVNGRNVEHWLNGVKVVEYEFGAPPIREAIARSKFSGLPEMAEKSPGMLELQNHGARVWFRNMRIRRLLAPPAT